ncbi:MORN-repeat protein [Orpheovirus IHUMI-LCC2]|uniref:MORN-repeat protein n=1 Tax=Orpheovirus IHUMI-LCC2 TaxID=2023057 RepID=A0A2I2L566_9VIRU|nr:MORN-repeat protein [Orpheovirus IHUMI-LCC2]SNW62667.1 MORN-repeat protein [Orpheovirus IHUMI-LCC2]
MEDNKVEHVYEKYGNIYKECYTLDSVTKMRQGEYKKYENDRIIVECYYSDGRLDEEYLEYQYVRNGSDDKYYKVPKVLCLYADGKLEGEYTEYYPNGVKKLIAHYNGGVLQGDVTKYSEDNILVN